MTATTNNEIEALQNALKSSLAYFERSTSLLTEEHSALKPNDSAFTAAQQIVHVALSTDWLMEGAFRGADGFNMDLEADQRVIDSFTSLEAAKTKVRDAYANAIALLADQSMETLNSSLPEGPVMGGMPRKSVVGAMVEHAAHHRGVLSVYARLAGLTPPMPYM